MFKLSSSRLLWTLQLAAFLAAVLPARAATITWTNSAGGNWNNAVNWSPNQVPGASDTAVFSTPGTYTVAINDNESVNILALGAASGTETISISSGTFTVNGPGTDAAQSVLNFSGGTLTGPGSVTFGGPLTWTGGNIQAQLQCHGGSIDVPIFSTLGYGGQLINTGELTWTANSGPRTGGNNSGVTMQTVISNAASAGINLILSSGNGFDSYVYGGATAFYNAGHITAAGAGQGSSIGDPFINTGTVTITNGTLGLSGGGTNAGLITVEADGTLNPNSGTFTSVGTLAGAGNLAVSGGTANLGGTNNLSGSWTFSGGTANLTGSSTTISTAVTNDGGTLNVTGVGPWLSDMAAFSAGTLTGTTPLKISGPLYWTGGDIEGLVQCNGGTVNVPIFSTLGYGGQLINTGALTWTPNSGPRTGGNNSAVTMQTVISNAASGTINIPLNGNNVESYAYGGATAFYNAGQIAVSGPGQSGSITDPLINTGTVTITNGTLGASDGGTNSGLISVDAGGTFNPNGGTFTSLSAISGSGSLAVSGGTANLGGSINLGGELSFSGGTANLTGASTTTSTAVTNDGGTVNFNGAGPWQTGIVVESSGTLAGGTPLVGSGPLFWTGGNIEGIVQCNGGTVNVPIFSTLGYGGQLINTGAMTWTPNSGPRTGGNNSAVTLQTVISNAATGIINIPLNGNNVESYAYGGATAFYNAGHINVSGVGQSGSITDPFINTGTVTVASGTLGTSDGGTNSGLISLDSNGTFNPNNGAFTSLSAISGAGSLAVSGGTANLGGTINLSGDLSFSGGTANLTGSSTTTSTAVTNDGGTVNFTGVGPWQTGMVAVSGGTLAGTTPLVASGPLYWTGGNIEGVLQCNGGIVNVPVFSTLGYGGQLINMGAMTWTPNSGPRTGGNNSAVTTQTVISNATGGIINIALNGNNVETYAYGGTTAFYNAGQINISGPGQSGSITDPFINSGIVNIQSGALAATAGLTSTTGAINFGITSTNSFATLAVSGAYTCNGTLGTLASGYIPRVGDSFPLITYGSESGIFSAFNLPPRANWAFDYGSAVFTLYVASLTSPYLTLQAITPPLQPECFTLLMLGPIGSNYWIQGATNLNPPDWVTLTNFVSVDTSFYYTDTTATNREWRVFRAVLVP